jgi:hypothetical protein
MRTTVRLALRAISSILTCLSCSPWLTRDTRGRLAPGKSTVAAGTLLSNSCRENDTNRDLYDKVAELSLRRLLLAHASVRVGK